MTTLRLDARATAHVLLALLAYRRELLARRVAEPFDFGLLDELGRSFQVGEAIRAATAAPPEPAPPARPRPALPAAVQNVLRQFTAVYGADRLTTAIRELGRPDKS